MLIKQKKYRLSTKAAAAQRKKGVPQAQKIQKEEPPQSRAQRKFVYWIIALCIAACILWIAGEWLYRYLFPKTVSIAVLSFVPSDNGTDSDISLFLPILLKDDFARCEHVTTIGSTSQRTFDPQSLMNSEITKTLHIQYFLTGDVYHQGAQYTITALLLNSTSHRAECKVSFSGEITALPKIRVAIVRSILQYLDMETVDSDNPPGYSSSDVYQQYLTAFHLISSQNVPVLDSAVTLLHQCIAHNKNFTAAEVLLAQGEMSLYARGGGNEQLLKEAFDLAQRSLASSINAAHAYRVIGEYYYFTQQFGRMIKNVRRVWSFNRKMAKAIGIFPVLSPRLWRS